jgi:excisionase family DNA binding protein
LTVTLDAEIARPDRANRIRQVAEIFNTSERHIWRLIADGKLRADRLGPRCVRIFDSEIIRFRASLRRDGGRDV